MSSYLDTPAFRAFLARYFGSKNQVAQRLIGRNREYDSTYFGIVRFLGREAVGPSRMELRYIPGMYEISDPLIREFTVQIAEELRAQGRLYDGPSAMRLTAFDPYSPSPSMTVQEARYPDQVGGLALDLPHPIFAECGGTLREYYKRKERSSDLRTHPLCLCLGICGYLMVEEKRERYLLQVRRSAKLASLENSGGPSVAGSVDYGTEYRTLIDLMSHTLGLEVTEELGLHDGEYSIIPLAYGREIYRGERPQLFCLIRTELTRAEVTERIQTVREEAKEFDSYQFAVLGSGNSNDLAGLNLEALANYYFVDEYLAVQK